VEALDIELRARGNQLIIVHAPDADQEQSAALVASVAAAAKASTVVVEATDHGSLGARINGRPPDMSVEAAAAMRTVLKEAVEDQGTHPVLQHAGSSDDGQPSWEVLQFSLHEACQERAAKAGGSPITTRLPKEEAAHKLITNHEYVVRDVTNQQPLTQLGLRRAPPSWAFVVDGLLREIAARLLGLSFQHDCERDELPTGHRPSELEENVVEVRRTVVQYLIERLHTCEPGSALGETMVRTLAAAGSAASVIALNGDDHRLLPHARACASLGRSRAGGGGKVRSAMRTPREPAPSKQAPHRH
jgi:hypothetical protein